MPCLLTSRKLEMDCLEHGVHKRILYRDTSVFGLSDMEACMRQRSRGLPIADQMLLDSLNG